VANPLESREFLEVALRSIADGVFAVYRDLKIIYFNRAAERITGWDREEAVGRPYEDVFRVDSSDGLDPLKATLDRGDVPIDFEEAMRLVMNYPFPGNVRELENIIEHAFVLAMGDRLRLRDLPSYVAGAGKPRIESGYEYGGLCGCAPLKDVERDDAAEGPGVSTKRRNPS